MRLFAVAGLVLVASRGGCIRGRRSDGLALRQHGRREDANNGPVIHMYYNADHTFTATCCR